MRKTKKKNRNADAAPLNGSAMGSQEPMTDAATDPQSPFNPEGSNGGGTQPESYPPPRARTADELKAEDIGASLAIRMFAARIAPTVLTDTAALAGEVLHDGHLLDDGDDEEVDDDRLSKRNERAREILDEGITAALEGDEEGYPTFSAVADPNKPMPDDFEPQVGIELRKIIEQHQYIGGLRFDDKFSREQIQWMVRSRIKKLLKENPKYSEHIREEVPGSDVKNYGARGRTSSKGTFAKSEDYESGGGLEALFTGGWMRVAKHRIDPYAWSHEHGEGGRISERRRWAQVFTVTERDGRKSTLEIPREKLAATGAAALKLLSKSGVHYVHRDRAVKAFVRFLRYRPRREIIRFSRPGLHKVESHWVFVRHDMVVVPPGMSNTANTIYKLDAAVTKHGLDVAGTVEGWVSEIAAPLRGNSNVALALATFFAAPLLKWISEPGGGFHLYGHSGIGKSLAGC
jgi:Domain of unknown function (DUF927)